MTTTIKDDRPAPAGTGWMITALGIGQICSWGSLYYSFPLIAEAMRVELGWSKPLLYGAASLGLALAGLAAYPVGAAIDRGLGRLTMSMASVAAGLLLVVWSQLSGVVSFYLVFAALGLLQAATLYEAAFAVIARRVGPENARHDIMTLTLWGGFASTVFIPLIQLMIEWYGWRGALQGLGAVNILVCGALHVAVIDPSRDRAPRERASGEAPPLSGRKAVSRVMRRPVFWALVLAFVAYSGAFSALTFHLYPLLLERGLDSTGVVAVMAVIGPAQVAGRMLVWGLTPHAPMRTVGALVAVIFPLAAAGFAVAPPDVMVITAIAAVYGVANGILTIVRGLAVPEMLSRDAYGAINGAMIAPMHLVQAAAPMAAAWLWAASGGYDAVLVAVFVGACLMAASFWAAAWLSRRG